MRTKMVSVVVGFIMIFLLASCQTIMTEHPGAAVGAGAGATTGAVAGDLIGKGVGAVILGGLLGGSVEALSGTMPMMSQGIGNRLLANTTISHPRERS